MEEKEINEIAENLIRNEVYCNVSAWVEASFEKELFSYDDLENSYRKNEDDEHGEEEPQEIFEWYIVSKYLMQNLREIGEPVIDNDYGYFWGRTCTGQSISLDGTIQTIVKNLNS